MGEAQCYPPARRASNHRRIIVELDKTAAVCLKIPCRPAPVRVGACRKAEVVQAGLAASLRLR